MSDRNGFLDGVYDFTLSNLRTLKARWRDFAGDNIFLPTILSDGEADHLRRQMQDCLEARGGEVSARARAAGLGQTYIALPPEGRARFLNLLANEFDIDRVALASACQRIAHARTEDEKFRVERALRQALAPPRVKLLTQFNALPNGVKFLVDMRAELMPLARHDEALAALDQDLRHLLASWFDEGFLEVKRITWDSPAALLEKLMFYEAVHEIRSWSDLKNRLEADRRCFAYFHPRMPDEPLIFVEVALVAGIAGNIHALLDESAPLGDPNAADTAIFYSISNCQRGLNGISFGDFLIKRVVDALAAELPRLKVFATLSPVPGFRAWLAKERQRPDLLTPVEAKALAAVVGNGDAPADLVQLLDRPGWQSDSALAAVLRDPLVRLCAQYLLLEKGRSGRAADPVAHFHLTNGARVERLDWLGDTSEKGLQQSVGIMVNYLYRLGLIETTHAASCGEGRVAASSTVRHLLRNR